MEQGLSQVEAARRLKEQGENQLTRHATPWYRILLRQFLSPFLWLLIVAAALSFLLGEAIDALMIGIFVLVNGLLGFGQEYHSQRAVELLNRYIAARATVVRDGQTRVINSRELVMDDVMILETGDIIQADVRLLEATGLLIDESILTGESAPAAKSKTEKGFAGTTVVSGRAVGMVIATGNKTEIGLIGKLAQDTRGASGFEKGIAQFSKFILRLILITLAIVFITNVIIKGGQANIPELILFSIALAVSEIPEAMPLVITMTLSRGALRLAKRKVVVKRLSSIEDLGSIQVLCTDKTGTLTENSLTLVDVWGDKKVCTRAGAEAAMLSADTTKTPNNAFDLALWRALDTTAQKEVQSARRSHEVPFDPTRRFNAVVVQERFLLRGAPHEVLALCENGTKQEEVLAWVAEQGEKGRRVLAVASRTQGLDAAVETGGFSFLGVLSFEDPVKPTTKSAIEQSRRLKVAMKILTGDSPEVAGAVAYEVGLIEHPSQVMTGEAWAALSQSERLAVAQSSTVFARVSPEQKFLIVQALSTCCEVGFLGEGINDAPALNAASVGIVVDQAADIAREAADIILLAPDLNVIMDGIREGREVFANTIKYIKATLSSNFGNFLAIASATLFIDELPMLPIQILLVNLLTDFPMIAIAVDRVDAEELKSPRSYDLHDIMIITILLGTVSTIFDFIFFGVFSHISIPVLQTNWFIGSILTELVLIFSIRSRRPFWRAQRPASILFWLSFLAAVVTVVIPFTTFGQRVFHFIAPSPMILLLTVGIVAVYFVTTETVKLGMRTFYGRQGRN